jgi:hypothetical protein
METNTCKIFNEDNIKNIQKILELPNDNYTCTDCELIPEILHIDYGTGSITFKCQIHGEKTLSLKDYFMAMSNNIYYNKKCSFCHNIQNNNTDVIFDYCLYCKKIICGKCKLKHTHLQTLKLNDLDNKCMKHHNKFYEYFCKECNQNFCSLCTEHKEHEEIFSSCDFIPTEEIKKLKKSNELFKKEIEILPYLIKINDLLITCQSKFSFNYFHNINLKNASNSFLQTDLFLKEINEIQEKIKSEKPNFASMVRPVVESIKLLDYTKKEIEEQKKLLDEFNTMYHTSLDGNEIVIELNDKDLGDSGFELLSRIKFKNLQKLNVKGNNITNIAPLSCLCNKNTKKLDLSFNKLNNISPLGQQNFNLKGVRKLLLNDNLIEDIGVFQMEDVFPNLKKLNLCNNRINFALKDTQQTLEKLKERLLELNYNNFSNNNTPDSMISNYSSNLTKIEDIEFLNERFKLKNPEISKINYILLYRGTRDGDRAKDFHDKVRGISKTLCVIKTPKGLFGGYTEATWDGDNCDKFDENAFCFSLTLRKIYELIEGKDAIGCNKDYGPIFRFTFLLNDKYFEKNAFCYPKTPHFNVEENKFELSGGEKYPKVIEFEAYQIIFE